MTTKLQDRRLDVLLVDDERDFVETLRDRLRARGIEAQAVFGGDAALDAVYRDAPRVMVLDLKMPGMGGLQVLCRMRELNDPPAVIVLTGHATDAELEEARRLGARECVRKPVDIRQLKKMIEGAGRDTVRASEEVG